MGDEMGYIAIHALARNTPFSWQAEAALMATGEQMLKVATGENTDRPTTPHTYGIIARYLHRDSRGRGAAISPVLMNTGISLAPFFRKRRALCGKCTAAGSKAARRIRWLYPSGAPRRAFAAVHASA